MEFSDGREPTKFLKRTCKGGVLRSRVNQFQLGDYINMGSAVNPEFELDLRKLQSRNWKMYFISQKRKRTHIFERKRRLINADSGFTLPFGYCGEKYAALS